MSHPARCRRCNRQLATRSPVRTGRRASTEHRTQPHAGRGLCEACRWSAGRDGTLAQYPPARTAIDADTFAHLSAAGADDVALAGHFGVSLAAVRKHRSRAKRAAA